MQNWIITVAIVAAFCECSVARSAETRIEARMAEMTRRVRALVPSGKFAKSAAFRFVRMTSNVIEPFGTTCWQFPGARPCGRIFRRSRCRPKGYAL